ncbi:hypothetical protein [Anaerosalibacter massiliensis]|uniref:Uncharacterized protein n=1 Tax=Anaerosalibacter massiliensis TaxID=1347392 RepID=A0A9X2MEZ3_9FIRM|nr:hypothetical protein [Anaerosalibacter massiliensis]MCR2042858.1 hypothetical protein [Anaerosalibacter massiliensis]
MNIKIKESELIKNSKGEYFNFYIDEKNNLLFNKFDNKNNNIISLSEIEHNILDFSVIIDEKDKIQLIYLIENGNLIHCTYTQKKWIKQSIFRLNTKSNIYKHITLFMSNNSVNIFYACANLVNINLWSIEQITKNSSNWTKKTVTSIFSKKILAPFYIDSDNLGNIHLVFRTNERNSTHIYYTFYNVFIKKWSQIIEKISLTKTNNKFPYLFIDSKNNIHILWSSLEDKDYILRYKKLSPGGQSKFKWKKINLPVINNCTYTPIMSEINETLKITYLKDDEIGCLNSMDYGETWILIDKIKLNSPSIWFLKYSSNSKKKYLNNKTNNFYAQISDKMYLFFNEKDQKKINFDKEEIINLNNKDIQIEEKDELISIHNSDFMELKKNILEIKETIEQIIAHSNIIEEELKLMKEKLMSTEDQKHKKGFFKFK